LKAKNTLIMAAVAALLLGYVYFFEIRGAEDRAEADRVADRLLSFESDNVTGLTLETPEETISMVRADDRWRITQPYDLAADDSAISSVVNRLQAADHVRLIEEQPDDLARFGLAGPEIAVTLQLDDGSTRTLAVGAGTPVGFDVFVRPGDGTAVYTTAAGLKDSVSKSLFDLRDRTVLSFVDPAVSRLEITAPDLETTVRRGADRGDGIDRWELAEPLEASADAGAVSSVLSRLRTGRALAYPTDAPSDEELAEFGLADPGIVVTVWTNDDAAHTLQIGSESEDPAGFYARRLGSDAVFVVPTGLVDALPEDAGALRNRRVVEFARDRIEAIELARPGETIDMRREGVDWRIHQPRVLDADASAIASLLTGGLDLQASEFATGTPDEARFGLAEPYLRVTFGLEPPPGPAPETPSSDEPESVVVLVGAATEIEPEPAESEEVEPEPAESEEVEPEPAESEEVEPEPTAARYLAIEGEPTVYVVAEDELADLDVNLLALRSKTLVSFAQSNLTRVEVDSEGATHRIDKGEDGAWASAEPAAAADLGTSVDDLLWSLNYLDFEGVGTEWDAEPPSDLGEYGLSSPSLRIRVFIDDAVVGEVAFGADVAEELLEDGPPFAPTTQTWVLVEGHPGVFRVDAKLRDNARAILDAIS